jgi:outer membrane protein TolC
VIPDLAASAAKTRAALDSLRARPEFEQFSRLRDVLASQAASTNTRELPRVSAFARAGYGRPGLNPLASEFDTYWLAGLQLEWNPWSWGSTRRDREVLSLQQAIVNTEEASFRETLRRLVVRDLAAIDRLERALAEDEAILSLREAVLREARARYREGVINSAEYIDRQTDVLSARLALSSHRVELAEARARFLTTIGLEARP